MLIHRYAELSSNLIRHVLRWKRIVSICNFKLTNCFDRDDEYFDDRDSSSRT